MNGVARVCSGLVDYRQALAVQEVAVELCRRDGMPTLLVLQHPPTVTYGKNTEEKDHRLSDAELEQRGITVVHVERSGRGTYHGPGQIVAYPLVGIPGDLGKGRHIRHLEDAAIALCADYGIDTLRSPDRRHPGVHIAGGNGKIAAVGVEFRPGSGHHKYVSLHGVAINVNVDTHDFDVIYPCGNTNARITSLAQVLGAPVDIDNAMRQMVGHLNRATGLEFIIEDVGHELAGV